MPLVARGLDSETSLSPKKTETKAEQAHGEQRLTRAELKDES